MRYPLSKWLITLLFVLLVKSLISQEVIGVGGTLEKNTVWTNEFTYVVRENLRIPEGIELIIMPGVIVEFYANTGLFVEQGSLKILGNYEEESDPIRLRPRGPQSWLGISFFSVSAENTNIIDHAIIDQADIGIDIKSSKHILVHNSTIQNGTTNDIRLHNSSFSLINNNSLINNGRHAIEIHASGFQNEASYNVISNNRITSSRLISLMVRFDNQGFCYNNIIENNLFENAESGIFIDNSSLLNDNDKIQIIGNVFANLGSELVGFSISTGMDSTIIQNNIFWNNIRGIELRRGNVFIVENNSFYQNRFCLTVEPFARNAELSNNTITGNLNHLITFRESFGNFIHHNNIFGNLLTHESIRNLTPLDISITNNFWGTSDTTKINALLWDKDDDENLGQLNYNPILEEPNILAPVSPPSGFVKQLINGEILLSWHANPEADLVGYALYHGQFESYRFADAPILIEDTTFRFSGNVIDDIFAITAFDELGAGMQQQQMGHESPFAFAVAIPFAGNDTLVCRNEGEFTVAQSTIPFPYEQLVWSSDGDGHFNDISSLRPTYVFGESDLETGSVQIALTVVDLNETIYTDQFLITLRNNPTVNAGTDIITPPTSQIQLDSIQAINYDQIEWVTNGDGNFNSISQLTPIYTFGEQDLAQGQVQLIVQAISPCGVDHDTLNVFIRDQYSVEGRVLAAGNGVSGTIVLAITELVNSVKHITAFAKTDQNGQFSFDALFTANYLFCAIPDTTIRIGYLPTYYHNKLNWQNAFLLPLQANTYDVDIELHNTSLTLPAGAGIISGNFMLPASLKGFDYHCEPWFDFNQHNYCTNGVSNITVLLYNDTYNIPFDYTLTDRHGDFYFTDLPFGDYYIAAEKAGFETSLSTLVSLNPNFPQRDDIILYLEGEQKIKVHVPDSETRFSEVIYPNPANESVNISTHLTGEGFAVIEVYNAFGQHIKRKSVAINPENPNRTLVLNTSDLPQGIYFIRLVSSEDTKTFRVIISR